MESTAYHAKYFAHDLTRRCASDSVEKLAAVLADAQVDLNPHQIEAVLFAFRNPFSRGAILADEVGLGKTIEAGLLISQKWAVRKQELLDTLAAKNGHWFDTKMDKLDRWAEDRRAGLKAELEELDQEIKEIKKAARLAPNLPEKLERQKELRKLETKRDEVWHSYDEASREIDRQKDALLDEVSKRLEQKSEQETLFTLRWKMV